MIVFVKDDGRADDEARLIEARQQRAQLQADEEIIDTDLALIQEREETIKQLEVSSCGLILQWAKIC